MLTSRQSERLLTIAEAATRLGLKIATIRRRILERRIAVVRIGRAVRIPIEVVDASIRMGGMIRSGLCRDNGADAGNGVSGKV